MFGPVPDRPAVAWLKGLLLPVAAIVASLIGYLLNSSPIWFAAASFGLFVAALGLRRLLEGSRWFHF
jgi:hypothetical protein